MVKTLRRREACAPPGGMLDHQEKGEKAVNLIANEHGHRAPQAASLSDLVDSVAELADLLHKALAKSGSQAKAASGMAAWKALNAARTADRKAAELFERIAYLELLASTDELTGLLNRRGFQAELHRTLSAAGRYEECGILVYVDLDGFKPVNDTYGHAAGDEVLRQVARILQENVRETDYVGRLGGDEFAVLLTRTKWDDGLSLAEVLDERMNSASICWQGRTIALRASLGFQAYGPEDDGHELLERADDAMYQTKRLRADIAAREASA